MEINNAYPPTFDYAAFEWNQIGISADGQGMHIQRGYFEANEAECV